MFRTIVKLFNVILMSREASGEDAAKKKPVDSEKDALKSRKQMEDSRQVSDMNSVLNCNTFIVKMTQKTRKSSY